MPVTQNEVQNVTDQGAPVPLATTDAGLSALTNGFDSGVARVPGPQVPMSANPPAGPAPSIDAPGFSQRFGAGLVGTLSDPQAAEHALNAPGGWAKAVLLNSTKAMAAGSFASKLASALGNSLGDASHASDNLQPGQGALKGVLNTLNAGSQREAAQKQQALDNNFKKQQQENEQSRLDLEKQRTAASIAEANLHELQYQKTIRNADQEFHQKSVENARQAAQPLIDAGAPVVAQGLDSDRLQERVQKDAATGHRDYVFQDGMAPLIGQDGKPVLDKNGDPQMRATWTILGEAPENIKLTKKQADDWNAAGILGQPVKEGQELPSAYYYNTAKKVQAQQGVQLAIDHVKAEIGEAQARTGEANAATAAHNQTIEEKRQNDRAKQVFAPWLAASNGDPILAYQNMAADPEGQKNIGQVQQLFGPGNLEKVRTDTIKSLEKDIEDNQKFVTKRSKEIDDSGKPASADEQQEISDAQLEIKQAAAKRNTYLGLHPSDPPRITELKKIGDSIPEATRATTIANSPSLTAQEKAYLLKLYGLTPPQPAQQQPAQQQPNQTVNR
jgi:hypothetical protein